MIYIKYKEVLKSIGHQWISVICVSAVSFFITLYIARVLGPEQFGDYTKWIAVGSFLIILFDLGLKNSVVKIFIKNYGCSNISSLQSHINFMCLISSLVAILCSLWGYVSNIDDTNFYISIFWAYSCCIVQLRITKFRCSGDLLAEAKYNTLSRSLSAASIFLILYFGSVSVKSILLVWMISNFLLSIGLLVNLSLPDIKSISTVSRFAIFYFISELSITLYIRSDVLIMDYYGYDDNLIGNYSAAFKFCELLTMISIPVGLVLMNTLKKFPVIQYKNLNHQLVIAILFGLLTSAFLAIYSKQLCSLLFGIRYQSASLYLETFWLMSSLILANNIVGTYLYVYCSASSVMYKSLISTITNICLNLFLIPSCGSLVPAYSKGAAELMSIITGLIFILYQTRSNNHKFLY